MQEKVQLFAPSGAINHSRFSRDRRSADAAVDSRSTVYRNFRRVLVEYDLMHTLGAVAAAPPRSRRHGLCGLSRRRAGGTMCHPHWYGSSSYTGSGRTSNMEL